MTCKNLVCLVTRLLCNGWSEGSTGSKCKAHRKAFAHCECGLLYEVGDRVNYPRNTIMNLDGAIVKDSGEAI